MTTRRSTTTIWASAHPSLQEPPSYTSLNPPADPEAGPVTPLTPSSPNHSVFDSILLAGLILLWYITSSLTNNLNKMLLAQWPYPVTLTLTQFLALVVLSLALLLFAPGMHLQRPTFPKIRLVLPLGFGHISGHLLNKIALARIAVSFTHTIKSASPIFTVTLARVYLHERVTGVLYASLIPIVVGVALCSATELQFDLLGFAAAFASTLIFVTQNIYSKRMFKEKHFDNWNLLLYTAAMSACLTFPVWLVTEAVDVFSNGDESNNLALLFWGSLAHFGQNAAAFAVMFRTSPLTYSVSNTMKRIFIITTSLVWFGNPITLVNALGMIIAIIGLFLYNFAKVTRDGAPALATLGSAGASSAVVQVLDIGGVKQV